MGAFGRMCARLGHALSPQKIWGLSLARGLCDHGGAGGAVCCPPLPSVGRPTVEGCVALWEGLFHERGVPEPRLSSEYIIAHILGAKTLASLGSDRRTELLTDAQTRRVWELCAKRLRRMPVQYVIEEWDFRELTLRMRPPVFIPRPETEELVGLVLTDLRAGGGGDSPRVLEVGCGSGAVALSLLHGLPQASVVAVDRSSEAISLTRANALMLGLQDRLEVLQLDVSLDPRAVVSRCAPVDVLVSNPPYLFSTDMATLEPEILRYEDHAALDGGDEGMSVITQILALAPCVLSLGGKLYLEVEPRQPALVQQAVSEGQEAGLRYSATHTDLYGRPRFCVLQRI
ncbi:MTRF1L release factor glutamine methyltransferase [Amia ocellicauda]|uniref:MTRF1L release factor glutamine methyltransferase n=1 Tax=Amia ocellicauda TaxID=2972642 RepID=UPI0034649BA8